MSRTTDFDREEIISKAMHVFWTKGYEGTSLKDLTEATGLLKGSLYNSFQSKENLYVLCMEKYGNHSRSFFYKEGDPKLYLKSFFKRLVSEGSRPENISGCLVMNSCLELASSNNAGAEASKALFEAVEMNFENVVNLIIRDTDKNAQECKTNLITAAFSIREISKFKKDKKFLKQIANNALKSLDLSI